MTDNVSLELAPINDQQPAGSDVRYEAEFEELQAEIDKLSIPSSTTGVDWHRVRALASEILRTKSKDLLVASYFTVADTRLNKLQGFAGGLSLYAGLLEQYWDTLYPAKKRMRGRLAAVTWLIEKSEAAFEGLNIEPVSADYVLSLKNVLARIDAVLSENCDDAPLLRPLERIIEEIPISEEVVAGEPEPRAEAPPESENKAETDKATSPQTQAPTPARPAVQERVVPPSSFSASESVSAAEVEKILREAFQTVRQAAAFYFEKDNANPRGYRCRRIAGWSLIQALPPATDKQTQIPPPGEIEEVRNNLLSLRGVEKWQDLLRESEQRLSNALLWLDLNRFSAESLTGLGSQYQDAHDAVCQETAFLLTRLPGLEKLTFSDGTPLADAETRQWLEMIIPGSEAAIQGPVSRSGPAHERMDDLLEQSRMLVAAKKLPDAISLLSSEMSRSFSRHEKLLWRLSLAQLLVNNRQARLALPHLEEIVEDIDTFRVEDWDPELAVHALKIVWIGFRSDKTTRERADSILGRIARLNPVEAMKLEK